MTPWRCPAEQAGRSTRYKSFKATLAEAKDLKAAVVSAIHGLGDGDWREGLTEEEQETRLAEVEVRVLHWMRRNPVEVMGFLLNDPTCEAAGLAALLDRRVFRELATENGVLKSLGWLAKNEPSFGTLAELALRGMGQGHAAGRPPGNFAQLIHLGDRRAEPGQGTRSERGTLSGETMSQRTTVLLVVSSHVLLVAAGIWLAGNSSGSSDLTFAPPPAAADPEKLKDDIARLADLDSRLATVKAILLGRHPAAKSTDEIVAEIESLPDGLREEALWTAFKETDQPENVLGLLDLFIEEEAWPRLEDPETLRQIQQLARAGDALTIAEWAVTLPIRPETTGLFRRSVEPFFREDWVAARDWIDALPPGTWRDRALAGYSQVALHDHNDPQASRRALQQISDSDLRAEAESRRTQWEKRTVPAEK